MNSSLNSNEVLEPNNKLLTRSEVVAHVLENGFRIDRYVSWLIRCAEVESLLKLQRQDFDLMLNRLVPLKGPAIVVGSAPHPTRPKGVDSSWRRVSVNASQLVLEHFELPEPHLTIFQPKIRTNDSSREVYWQSLRGKGTGQLLYLSRHVAVAEMREFLREKNYCTNSLLAFSESMKAAVVADLTGQIALTPFEGIRSVSNGLFAALLAAKLGANPVVMSGFSVEGGWFHAPDMPAKRNHVLVDKFACRNALSAGVPIFTTEPAFATETGLPIWPAG